MTFQDYMAQRKAGFDEMGDFMRLARSDTSLPDVQTWPELRSYLEAKGMPPQVIEGGEKVWAAYRKALGEARRIPERNRRAQQGAQRAG